MPDFGDRYAAYMMERAKSCGTSLEKIENTTREANVALTFAEVFPIGLGATLVSAAILRTRPQERGDVNE